jgi:hypothetical protein
MKTSVSEEMIVAVGDNDPMYDDTFTVYPPSLTQKELEEVVVFERLCLYNRNKPCGAKSLQRHLRYLGLEQLPSISSINRILSKHCLTNNRTGYYPEDYC